MVAAMLGRRVLQSRRSENSEGAWYVPQVQCRPLPVLKHGLRSLWSLPVMRCKDSILGTIQTEVRGEGETIHL